MLVLSRRIDERLSVIVDGVKLGELVIVRINGRQGHVKLGFDGFAANVQFARKEVEQHFLAEAKDDAGK